MKNPHWNQSQMLDHLYGIGPGDGHLDSCPRCRLEVERLTANRQRREQPAWIPEEFFALQRRRIQGRILEAGVSPERRTWLPAFATMTVLAMAVLLMRTEPPSSPSLSASNFNDGQLYTEIYQSIESAEPRALAPMHSLFQDQD
jgi:hypothetical protein